MLARVLERQGATADLVEQIAVRAAAVGLNHKLRAARGAVFCDSNLVRGAYQISSG